MAYMVSITKKKESSNELSEDAIKFALETWKTAIGVQQHFNTIEMQIRGLAVTVLTASIGAAGVIYSQLQETMREAMKNNQPVPPTNTIHIAGLGFSASDMIVMGGLIAWLAFYIMDRHWYHRLLQGAVSHAQYVENVIKEQTSYCNLMGLSNEIRLASSFKVLGLFRLNSDRKIDLFYGIVFAMLILIIAFVY